MSGAADKLALALEELSGVDDDLSPDDLAALIEQELADRDVYLMEWPDKRAPARMELTSATPAGPIGLKGDDLAGMGVRFVVEAQLTGAAMILNLPYQDAAMLGSWLVARSMMAEARRNKREARDAVPAVRPEGEPVQPDQAQPGGGRPGGAAEPVH